VGYTHRTASTLFLLLLLESFPMRCLASFVRPRISLSTYRRSSTQQSCSYALGRSYRKPFDQTTSIEARRMLTVLDGSKFKHNNKSLTRTSLRKMRVADLRHELEQRGMDTMGTRDVLLDRMFKVIDASKGNQEKSNKLSDVDESSLSTSASSSASGLCINPEHTFLAQISGVVNTERGTAASGIMLYDNDEQSEVWTAQQFSRKEASITETTYYGLMTCLRFARKHQIRKVIIEICDGNVVDQISGKDQVKDEKLKKLHWVVMKLKEDFDSFDISEKNEMNAKVNRLATTALDTERSYGIEFLRDETFSRTPKRTDTSTTKPFKVSGEKPYLLRVDGGARGNPGRAGAGMVLYDPQGKEIWYGWKYLGETTNNVAEYSAVLMGLQLAHSEGILNLRVESDSELVVKQLNGQYKVRNDVLKAFHEENLEEIEKFDSIEIRHILRGENKRADKLANRAMDTMGSNTSGSESNENKFDVSSTSTPKPPSVQTPSKVTSAPSVTEGTYLLQVDGGSRGNPGDAGAGMVLYDSMGNEIWSGYKFLGTATNNIAEYTAMLLGLRRAHSLGITTLKIECDSQLVVRQIEGVYKVKNMDLKKIYSQVMKEKECFSSFDIKHVMRADNKRADELANQAMDTRESYGL